MSRRSRKAMPWLNAVWALIFFTCTIGLGFLGWATLRAESDPAALTRHSSTAPADSSGSLAPAVPPSAPPPTTPPATSSPPASAPSPTAPSPTRPRTTAGRPTTGSGGGAAAGGTTTGGLTNVPGLGGNPTSAPSAGGTRPAGSPPAANLQPRHEEVAIPAGSFWMGNDNSRRAAERPAHQVRIAAFMMDAQEVTVAQFARFVEETGYRTTAEQIGWGWVFERSSGQWRQAAGADWQHPDGSHTTTLGREDFPVVQVSWHDAQAYATWSKRQLPTEAQWEYAARGGLRDGDFSWGTGEQVNGHWPASLWQGWFPQDDLGHDGFRGPAPTKSFMPSRWGLFDMTGNVAEWCADWYGESYYAGSPTENPSGPRTGIERVHRGGSWISAANYTTAHTVWGRSKESPTYRSNTLGFRTVRTP